MNSDLQNLTPKVEDGGTTPQGRLTASEWNILVSAVKSLDLAGGAVDTASILQVVIDAGYATKEWVKEQGYITSLNIESLTKNTVTLDTSQAITGIKDFANGLKIGGLHAYKSQDDTIYLDANLVVRGGVTAYGTNKTITASLFEALPIDGETIKRNPETNALFVDTSIIGGGGIDEGFLSDYLTEKRYATQDWVLSQRYLAGISASMVTDALGYTPLSTGGGTISGNISLQWGVRILSPDGNIVGTRKFGDDTINYRTIIGTATLNTLLISNDTLRFWKGSDSKEYTIFDSSMQSISIPQVIATSIGSWQSAGFRVSGNGMDVAFGANDSSSSAYIWLATKHALRFATNNAERMRISDIGYVGIGTQTPSEKLEVSGKVKATSFIGDLVGNADSASKLATPRTIWGQSFDGTQNLSGNLYLGDGTIRSSKSGTDRVFIDFGSSGDPYIGYGTASAGIDSHLCGNNIYLQYGTSRATGLILNSSGNIGIGTTNPSVKAHIVGRGVFENTLSGSAWVSDGGQIRINCSDTAYWLGLGMSKEGWAIIQGGENRVGARPILLNPKGGNVGIGMGTNSPSEKLVVNGNILAMGGITAQNSSDRRLKRNIRKFNASKVLMSLGGVYEYEYIDSEVQKNHIYEGTHYGLIYQNITGTNLKVMCHEREDGFGTLNYQHQKFISLIAGATMENISEVEKLKRKIRTLEAKVKQLERG